METSGVYEGEAVEISQRRDERQKEGRKYEEVGQGGQREGEGGRRQLEEGNLKIVDEELMSS